MEPADSFDVFFKALRIEDEDERIQTLRTLIESGVDVNSCWDEGNTMMYESYGLTVLMVAVRYGDVDCVQVLLDAGADVNQSNVRGTALMEAASNGLDECMRLLIKAGADVDQSENNGITSLMTAVQYGYYRCERMLLEAGANVNHVDNNLDTALIRCLCFYNRSDVKPYSKVKPYSDSKTCLKLLVEAGADIEVKNISNLQPIHYVIMIWRRATFPVKYLLSENCNLNQASYDPVKARWLELKEEDRIDIVQLLFACGLPRHLCQSFIVEKETSVRNWVHTVASQPNTLKLTCVFEIRRSLGRGIKSKVTKLNLPNVIQNLILLKGILSLECFD